VIRANRIPIGLRYLLACAAIIAVGFAAEAVRAKVGDPAAGEFTCAFSDFEAGSPGPGVVAVRGVYRVGNRPHRGDTQVLLRLLLKDFVSQEVLAQYNIDTAVTPGRRQGLAYPFQYQVDCPPGEYHVVVQAVDAFEPDREDGGGAHAEEARLVAVSP
jgi:hypothetical protein